MAEMEKRGMTLIAIHDRPLKTELGEYYYLIECTGSYKSYEALTKEADFAFRYLGSFPSAETEFAAGAIQKNISP